MDFLFLFRGVALPWKANSDEVKHITAFSDIVFKVRYQGFTSFVG